MTTSVMLGIIGYIVYAVIDVLFIDKKVSFFPQKIFKYSIYLFSCQFQPISTLFKPDFKRFKPKSKENQKLAAIYRGLDVDSNEMEDFSNMVCFFKYFKYLS